MIDFINLSKSYGVGASQKEVLRGVNFSFPAGLSVGILGGEGCGKTTLLRILSGLERPSSGRVETEKLVSWPIDGSVVQSSLSPADNVRFVCRVYGDSPELERQRLDFVRSFSGVDEYFKVPVKKCPAGVKTRLSFGLVFAFDFDYYLIDDGFLVGGDALFKKKVKSFLRGRLKKANAIFASRDVADVKDFCDAVAVLDHGSLRLFLDVNEGLGFYKSRRESPSS